MQARRPSKPARSRPVLSKQALSKPLRSGLLAAARSERLERAASNIPLTRKVVDRFVAGESEQQAIATSRDILASGRSITIDHLGEDTTDAAQADATVSAYLSLLSALTPLARESAGAGPRPVEVSLKLSALGQSLSGDGERIALDNAHKICAAADEAGVWVTVDAEDHTTTDSTLSIVRALRDDFPTLGTVLQAYLKRTEADCADLAGPGSRIRLCKGAYAEPASVAHQGDEVDAAYVRCLEVLMRGEGYPMVATHDPAMVEAGLRLAGEAGRGSEDYELQMLYGIRDVEQRRLADGDRNLRVYLPYGTEWYGYFVRRLAEKPANLALFLRAMTSKK